jgi:hypothetical protein
VDDDDMFAMRDEDDDGPGALPGPRTGEVTAGAAAAEFMAALTRHLPHPDDAAGWAAREAADRDKLAAEARHRAAAELERRARYLRTSGIDWPARLVDDALAADPQRPLMLRVAQFGAPPRAPGSRNVLVLEGGVGAGKSTAGTWWAMRFGGSSPLYIRSATFEGEGRYDKAMRARLRDASSIVLDDLGAEFKDGRGNLVAALDELIDMVYSQRLPAVITTNLTGEAFKARYGAEGERMRSRLRGCARWASVSSSDLRTGLT